MAPADTTPVVLFVCVHHAGDRVQVLSAGSEPADGLNPAVVEAMAEVDIDITRATPTLLDTEMVREADVVVTMGCGDTCPFFPGKRYLDWELEDPAGHSLGEVRPIRDEIERRVLGLIDELGCEPGPP
jgi:protein-tyrosine-phosphatase